jgi:phage-related protein
MTREISWVGSSLKDFRKFPDAARREATRALQIAANGETADSAKAMKGLGAGVFEIALRYRTDAYRVVYAVQLGADIYVLHAFQKKSKTGIKTPKQDVDLMKARLKEVRRMLNDR